MVCVDTGPLVALCDPRDARHATATGDLGRLAGAGLVTCEAVLVEACLHLPHLPQRLRLRDLVEDLHIKPLMTGDREFRSSVLDWLVKYGEHEPDWADGCLAVLSGRDKRLRIWTYDREFRTTWRRPDGGAIPLGVR